MASEPHDRKAHAYLEATEGKVLASDVGEGWTVRPALIVHASLDSAIAREEVFGLIVTIDPFDEERDGVVAANDSCGLDAMVFTVNLCHAQRVSPRPRPAPSRHYFFNRDLRAPLGGIGESGWGAEDGDFRRKFLTEPKALVIAIAEG